MDGAGVARAVAAIAAASIAAGGCSTYATIQRIDGVEIPARITHSDQRYLYLDTEAYGAGHIPREHVKDIDHPGSLAAAIGTLGGVIGTVLVVRGIVGLVSCSGDLCGNEFGAYAIPGAIIAVSALPTAIWGWAVWADSTSAAEPSPDPQPPSTAAAPASGAPPLPLAPRR